MSETVSFFKKNAFYGIFSLLLTLHIVVLPVMYSIALIFIYISYHYITCLGKMLLSSFFSSSLNSFQVPTIPCYQICQNLYLFLPFECSSKWFHAPLQSTIVRQLDLNYHIILTDEEVTI